MSMELAGKLSTEIVLINDVHTANLLLVLDDQVRNGIAVN